MPEQPTPKDRAEQLVTIAQRYEHELSRPELDQLVEAARLLESMEP